MRRIKILTYSLDLALTINIDKLSQSLEIKIFNEKVEILFDFFILKSKTTTFSLNILGSRDCMMTFN